MAESQPTEPVAPAASALRFCPTCGKRMAAAICSQDGIATLPMLPLAGRPDPMLGTTLADRYRLDSILGEGGMGRVYAATQLNLGQRVAIKMILPERQSGEVAIQRFHREAKSTTRLSSPHVVRVFDFGVDPVRATPYIVMECLKGRTLGALLRAGSLPIRRVLTIAGQITRALVDAEREAIIHRDLKPENVFLLDTADGHDFVKVMDFGIARSVPGAPDGLGSITVGSGVVGTPAYMSPEQASGLQLDTRSDLYALGCILHEMLTSRRPYPLADDGLGAMLAHLTQPVPELPDKTQQGERIQDSLRQLHRQLLQKAPSDRPKSARDVLAQLMALLDERVGRSDVQLRPNKPDSAPMTQDTPISAKTTPDPPALIEPFASPAPAATGTPPLGSPAPPHDQTTVPFDSRPGAATRRGRTRIAAAAAVSGLIVAAVAWFLPAEIADSAVPSSPHPAVVPPALVAPPAGAHVEPAPGSPIAAVRPVPPAPQTEGSHGREATLAASPAMRIERPAAPAASPEVLVPSAPIDPPEPRGASPGTGPIAPDVTPLEQASESPPDGKPQTRKPHSGKPQSGKPQSGKPQSGKPQSGKPLRPVIPEPTPPPEPEPQSPEPPKVELW